MGTGWIWKTCPACGKKVKEFPEVLLGNHWEDDRPAVLALTCCCVHYNGDWKYITDPEELKDFLIRKVRYEKLVRWCKQHKVKGIRIGWTKRRILRGIENAGLQAPTDEELDAMEAVV